jgi:hypothetical protein
MDGNIMTALPRSVSWNIYREEDVDIAAQTTTEYACTVASHLFINADFVPRVGEQIVIDLAKYVTAGRVFRVLHCTDISETVVHVDAVQVQWP